MKQENFECFFFLDFRNFQQAGLVLLVHQAFMQILF